MTKPMGYGLALLLACAVVLAGCGGSGGGEPTVTQTLHDELQADLDAALADLATEREAKGREAAARATAETAVERLGGELETAQGRVAELTTELATTRGNVTDLADELQTATANVTRLTGELRTAEGRVDDLTAEIGGADDAAKADGSLHAQLNHAKAEVTRLTTLVGAATDAASAAGSLNAQINAAKAEVTRLTTELGTAQTALTTAQARVGTLETLVGDATAPTATSLRGQIAKLTVDLAAEKAKVTALTSNLATAQQQAQQARQEAADQVREAQQQVQGLEAIQRAKNLEAAFGEAPLADAGGNSILSGSPVTIESKSGSLTIKSDAGGFSFRTGSVAGGTGIRSTTLGLVSGGASTGKTVVFTDREVTREILKHYGSSRDETNNQFSVIPGNTGADLIILGANGTNVATAKSGTPGVSVSHALRTSLGANDKTLGGVVDNRPDPDTEGSFLGSSTTRTLTSIKEYFTGSVHGVPGRFLCGAGCEVTATGIYHDNASGPSSIKNRLDTVRLTVSGGGADLYFRPNSAAATVSLCDDDLMCTAGSDDQYMVFGYWREDPKSAAGAYTFDHFAEIINTGGQPVASVNGTYRGKAVGAYVEKDPVAVADTYRQGEFSANVVLTATSASDTTGVTGTIGDFDTTPTGGSTAPSTAGRWVLTLAASNVVELNLPGGGSATQGRWDHQFVPAHADAATATPPAVVGAFDARIPDSVSIVGAFGAER